MELTPDGFVFGERTAIALRSLSEQLTYGELAFRVNHAAAVLDTELAATKPGYRRHVLVVIDHSVDSVVALLAASLVGLAIPATSRDIEAGHFSDVPIDISVAPDGEHVTAAGRYRLSYEDIRDGARDSTCARTDPSEPSILVSTSGTTGARKWVVHSRNTLASAAGLVAKEMRLSAADVSLAVMPLNHTHGLVTTLLAPLTSGGTVVLADPRDVMSMRSAMEQRVSCVSASPTLHRYILKVRELFNGDRFNPDRVRIASDTLTPQLLGQLLDAYSVPVIDTYALTELPGTIMTRTLRRIDDLASPYRPAPSVVCRVGRETAPSERERGELLVDGPHRMCGFYDTDRRDVSPASIAGFVASGDLVDKSLDDEFRLIGRAKEMINRGGETIPPATVERIVERVDGVSGALAFGEPHDLLGEAVAVAVTVTPGTGRNDVRSKILGAVPSSLQPMTVHVVDDLPVKENGKVDRSAARKRIQSEKGFVA